MRRAYAAAALPVAGTRRHTLAHFSARTPQGGGEALLSNFTSATQPNAAPVTVQARALSVELVLAVTAHPDLDWFTPPTTSAHTACHGALRAWAAASPGIIRACFALQHSSTPGEPITGLQVLAFWLSWARASCTADKALHLSANILDALAAWAVATARAGPSSAAVSDGAAPASESSLAAMLYNDFVRWVPSHRVASGSAPLGTTRPAEEVERLVQQLAQRCAAEASSSSTPARKAVAPPEDTGISLDPFTSSEYATDASTLAEAHRLASLYKHMGDQFYRLAKPAEAAAAYAECMTMAAHIASYPAVCAAVRLAAAGVGGASPDTLAWQRFLGVRLAVLRVSAASNLVAIAQQEPKDLDTTSVSAQTRTIACACTALQLALSLLGAGKPAVPVSQFASAAWVAALQTGAGYPDKISADTCPAEDDLPALVQGLATEGQAWLQAAGAPPRELAACSQAVADVSESFYSCRPAKFRFLCLKTLIRLGDAWREARQLAAALDTLRAAASLSQQVPDQPCGPALPWTGLQLGVAKRVSSVEAEQAIVQAMAAPGSGLHAELAAALSLRAEFGGEPETEADALAREEAAFAAEHDEQPTKRGSSAAAPAIQPSPVPEYPSPKPSSTASVSSSRVASAAASSGPASLAAIQQAAGRKQSSKTGAKSSSSSKRTTKKPRDKFANLRGLL